VLAGQHEEGRQQRVAALNLVRLHRLLAHEARQELPPGLQRGTEVLPLARERVRLDPAELEVVHAAEEPQGRVPAQLVNDVVDQRLGSATAGEVRVDRRALLLEMLRLMTEDRAPVREGRL
jgi:hypothetical protein